MQRSRQAAIRRLAAKVCEKCGLIRPESLPLRKEHNVPFGKSRAERDGSIPSLTGQRGGGQVWYAAIKIASDRLALHGRHRHF